MKSILRFTALTVLSFCLLTLASLASDAAPQTIKLPLHTSGVRIVDANDRPLRLVSVNWYGFDEKEYVVGGLDKAPLPNIVARIRNMGFNSVRLPWANETLEQNPVVPEYAVKANPQFRGKHAMEVMDAVIDALSREHIMVVLDNHVSRADWCCNETDGNGLWASEEYPESRWIEDWQTIVRRYKSQPYVIGADLRNELRNGAQWGGNDPKRDWRAAAERAGNAVLAANPDLLIFVEGPQYSTDFREALKTPIRLNVPAKLVLSPHDYGMSHPNKLASYEDLKRELDTTWGFMLHDKSAVPLWVGEFGICQKLDMKECQGFGQWFPWFVQYLKDNDLSWSYWPLNGTESSGKSRQYGAREFYGLLDTDYQTIAAPEVLKLLQSAGLNPR